MPADDIRRVAWFARSQYGSMIFQMPHEVHTRNNDEHREAVCTVLALPSPAAADIVGKEIPTNNPHHHHQHVVDEVGWNLTNAAGWEGDSRRTDAHNELEGVFAEALIEGGLRAYRAEKTKERLARSLPVGNGRSQFQAEPTKGEERSLVRRQDAWQEADVRSGSRRLERTCSARAPGAGGERVQAARKAGGSHFLQGRSHDAIRAHAQRPPPGQGAGGRYVL